MLDGVLQFPHIPRPRIGAEQFERFGIQLRRGLAELMGEAPQESVRELCQILTPLTQRWNLDLKGLQPEIQILPQLPILHRRSGRTVARCNKTEINRTALRRAERAILAILEHPQKAGLQFDGHLRHLIEEKRAAICLRDHSGKCRHRARECPLRVAEQLPLDHVRGKRPAVQLHHRRTRPRAPLMEAAGDHFLADSALSREQHIRLTRRDTRDELLHFPHPPADCHRRELLLGGAQPDLQLRFLLFEHFRLFHERLLLQRAATQADEFLHRIRLRQEMKRAELD